MKLYERILLVLGLLFNAVLIGVGIYAVLHFIGQGSSGGVMLLMLVIALGILWLFQPMRGGR